MPENSGPEDQHQTPKMVAPPTFRRFVDLEKSAKYYMMLLKVRETEIERCTKAYEDLQITLKCCLSTNSKLKDRIELLEQMLSENDENKRKEMETHRKEVANLNQNLAATRRNDDARMHELENEFKRKILETDKMYADKLNRQQIEFDKKLDEVKVKLQRETVLNSKLKNDLESLMCINVGFKTKLHLLKTKHSSQRASWEIELAELKDINKNSNAEVIRLRRELDRAIDQTSKFKQIIVEYQSTVQRDTQHLEEVSRINKTYKRINNTINSELWECKEQNKELRTRLEELIREEDRLKEEIQRLRVLSNVRSSHVRCNVPEHGNYEQVTRQNAVLQEIIKTMRKERDNKENEELRQAEGRIEKLEDALEDFKKSGLFKAISVHSNGHDGDK